MTALAIVDWRYCHDCGAPVNLIEVEQDALFKHGGYGATSRTVQALCSAACGWSQIREVTEIRPPRGAA